jgi:hypothetical protein
VSESGRRRVSEVVSRRDYNRPRRPVYIVGVQQPIHPILRILYGGEGEWEGEEKGKIKIRSNGKGRGRKEERRKKKERKRER